MVRPDGIPEDIWNASQFIMGWEHRLMPDNARHLTEEVARAILAERDRWLPAVTYFDRYCQDEADDAENCVCGQQQHVDAKNFRDVAHPFIRKGAQ
jgi:hypothetical protein